MVIVTIGYFSAASRSSGTSLHVTKARAEGAIIASGQEMPPEAEEMVDPVMDRKKLLSLS